MLTLEDFLVVVQAEWPAQAGGGDDGADGGIGTCVGCGVVSVGSVIAVGDDNIGDNCIFYNGLMPIGRVESQPDGGIWKRGNYYVPAMGLYTRVPFICSVW